MIAPAGQVKKPEGCPFAENCWNGPKRHNYPCTALIYLQPKDGGPATGHKCSIIAACAEILGLRSEPEPPGLVVPGPGFVPPPLPKGGPGP